MITRIDVRGVWPILIINNSVCYQIEGSLAVRNLTVENALSIVNLWHTDRTQLPADTIVR